MDEAERLDSSVREFLAAELHLDGAAIDVDTALVSSGLVDSVAMIRLAAVVERECDLVIPDRDVSAEHFDSIRKIREYVAARLS